MSEGDKRPVVVLVCGERLRGDDGAALLAAAGLGAAALDLSGTRRQEIGAQVRCQCKGELRLVSWKHRQLGEVPPAYLADRKRAPAVEPVAAAGGELSGKWRAPLKHAGAPRPGR